MKNGNGNGSTEAQKPTPLQCAIYTRKSTEEGLDQDFNSLDAQREAAEAFILSQHGDGEVGGRDAGAGLRPGPQGREAARERGGSRARAGIFDLYLQERSLIATVGVPKIEGILGKN